MPSDKIALSSMTDLLAKKLGQQIVTKAAPKPDILLQARAEINLDPGLGGLFKGARQNNSTPESLADSISVRLSARWPDVAFSDVWDAAMYLADEFFQVGEGLHVVSTETGQIVATLDEKDIYQPAPVPREGGGLAMPLPQIRPGLEAFITTWTFERSREARIVEALAKRAHQTDLLKEDGDPRLFVATRRGRALIVDALSKHTAKELLGACGGTSAAFLSHFTIEAEPPTGLVAIQGTATSRSEMKVADQTTLNLHHNRAATLRGALVQGWVREMARTLSEEARKYRQGSLPYIDVKNLSKNDLGTARFWIAPPDAVGPLKNVDPTLNILPVAGAEIVGFLPGLVGALVVPEAFQADSAEIFSRWMVNSSLDYTIYVDFERLLPLNIGGIEHMVEVLNKETNA